MGQGWRVSAGGLALALCAFGCGAATPEGKLTLALKYVAYVDSREEPVISEAIARGSLAAVNELWAPCEIAFALETYEPVSPGSYGLRYRTRDYSELQDIRKTFGTPSEFLLVATGPWDRSGSLGDSAASAWTAMPAVSGPFGAVLEERVGDYAVMIAHELGHYLGLRHVDDDRGVMNPIIYPYSKRLGTDQCEAARGAVGLYWRRSLRGT